MSRTLTILALAVVACGSPAPQSTSPKPTEPVTSAQATPPGAPYDAVFASYEHIRQRLAADDPAVAAATDFAKVAREAHLDQLAAHGTAIAAAKSLDAARTEFGELSRAVIALVADHPELQRNRHVFACPMVKTGYNKWVQPTDELANPYMGSAMLACGGESTWK